MEARFRSWWWQIKRHRVTILSVAIILIIAIGLIIVGYRFDWTGFNGNNKSGKTLWDWMQLLLIPVILAVAGFWFNNRERKAAELRARADREIEQKRAIENREIEQRRADTEQKIALDNQQEVALQAYINEMSDLLLRVNLRNSKPDDEVRTIARVKTLIVLSRLDKVRKWNVLQFLLESKLIDKGKSIIDLDGANLRGANLIGAQLHESDLGGVDLQRANLSEASLYAVNLRSALLIKANLERANLNRANLYNVDLGEANLNGVTGTTPEQLAKAKSLKGATMPDGTIHP